MKHLLMMLFFLSCNQPYGHHTPDTLYKLVTQSIKYYVINNCIQDTIQLKSAYQLYDFIFPDTPPVFKEQELYAHIYFIIGDNVIGGLDPSDHQSMRNLLTTVEQAAFRYVRKFDSSVVNVQQRQSEIKIVTSKPWLYNKVSDFEVILTIDCQL